MSTLTIEDLDVLEHDDEFLNVVKYGFTFDDTNYTFTLNKYSELSRPTRKHKYVVIRYWNAYWNRLSTMSQDEVPEIPERIKEFIISEYVNSIKFRIGFQR